MGKRKLSAFKLAHDVPGVCAQIDVDDVLQVRPDWSRDHAIGFLNQYGADIGEAMAIRGVEYVVRLIAGGPNAN